MTTLPWDKSVPIALIEKHGLLTQPRSQHTVLTTRALWDALESALAPSGVSRAGWLTSFLCEFVDEGYRPLPISAIDEEPVKSLIGEVVDQRPRRVLVPNNLWMLAVSTSKTRGQSLAAHIRFAMVHELQSS